MVINQGAVAITQSGNAITISGDSDDLVAFPSSVQAQGTHKWIGLDINTGLSSIVGATWNGSALTQADADEASSLGLAAGHIVFWAKQESLPFTVQIGATGKPTLTLSFSWNEQ